MIQEAEPLDDKANWSVLANNTDADPIEHWLGAQSGNITKHYDIDEYVPFSATAPHESQFHDSDFEKTDPLLVKLSCY